jgi:hypothetical protein
MKPKVPERVAVARSRILAELSEAGKQRFAARRIGTTLEVVAESPVPGAPGNDPASDIDQNLRIDRHHLAVQRLAPGGDSFHAGKVLTAVSTDFLRLAVRGVPPGAGARFRCLVASPSADHVHDLIADYCCDTL